MAASDDNSKKTIYPYDGLVGWLRAESEATARAGRKALRRLREAEPFW